MKFTVNKPKENIPNFVRKWGYRVLSRKEGEFGCVKLVGGARYPRFHLYIKEQGNDLVFNLHLDQKKPSYAGSSAHSGEYDGELVEGEAERIKNIIKELE